MTSGETDPELLGRAASIRQDPWGGLFVFPGVYRRAADRRRGGGARQAEPTPAIRRACSTTTRPAAEYLVSQYQAPYVDGNTGEQVSRRECAAFGDRTSPRSPGDKEGRLERSAPPARVDGLAVPRTGRAWPSIGAATGPEQPVRLQPRRTVQPLASGPAETAMSAS